jgi:hypothetical protein
VNEGAGGSKQRHAGGRGVGRTESAAAWATLVRRAE